ncbi:NADH-ubiquinone oxidoreductase-F iron-sulfur binding region domain-containing protein [Haloarchaeobius amylolyticus]|uniref:NADH-ubiquinone oxidoreductase-F iron-sulfur binding region domain-containing protein n=1 Tax=Haloarchaeobius amylolyticus TaxID=1198296 RepID=UPI00226DB963|nr:NADH-ubiquinone oxidoreductase-F iron-sulfur binding region domain-containing protein [Haloarchaeobius amylolyticus]
MTQNTGGARAPTLRIAGRLSDERRAALVETATELAERVSVVPTGSTGVEGLEPLALATHEGRTAFLPEATAAAVERAIEALEAGGLPTETATVVVEHGETAGLPLPHTGPLAVGTRRVLAPCGWVDPTSPADVALVSPERDAGSVADVGILGRGRGDASSDDPVAAVWQQARKADGKPVVVVNAHEADSRPRADRLLLESAPLTVLDGAAAVADHVGASDLVVYLNEADEALRRQVQEAIENAADVLPVVPQVVVGPDLYRAGAPTTALEAMEGADRLEPRLQPPPPSVYGLHGRPTVIHTPRTVAQVRQAMRTPDAFDPDDADPGTRLVTATGDVAAPATVELPPGGRLDAVREAVDLTGRYELACVGGVLGGFTRELGVAPTAPSLAAASLGTDGVVELLTEDTCVVAVAGERARFAADENSGRCVPGREGTVQLAELVRDVYDGEYDPEKIRELGRVMRRSANCQLGSHAPRPVVTAMDEFAPAFRAHTEGHCPAGTCTTRLRR